MHCVISKRMISADIHSGRAMSLGVEAISRSLLGRSVWHGKLDPWVQSMET